MLTEAASGHSRGESVCGASVGARTLPEQARVGHGALGAVEALSGDVLSSTSIRCCVSGDEVPVYLSTKVIRSPGRLPSITWAFGTDCSFCTDFPR